jgi:adenylosuccinate lyase
LLKFVVQVEVRWLQKLAAQAASRKFLLLTKRQTITLIKSLLSLAKKMHARIKTIERTTNHDVKAVDTS